jgi:hypothetical protein
MQGRQWLGVFDVLSVFSYNLEHALPEARDAVQNEIKWQTLGILLAASKSVRVFSP